MKKITNGLLIILEGGEGVGKTTQAKALVDYYNSQGYSTKYFREPGGDKLTEEIRNMVLYNEMDAITETFLMSAARNINIKNNILPALKNGNIVILDRFYKSTMVYQGVLKDASMSFIRDCTFEVCKNLYYNNVAIVEFTLLCEPEEAMKRAAAEGHERNKNDILPVEDYKKINDAYRDFYFNPPLGFNYSAVNKIIDTTNIDVQSVYGKLVEYVNNTIKKFKVYEE